MSAQRRIVLILDDDDAVRESFVDYFEDRGWLVVPAATAEDALDLLAQNAPDGAVVDIRLPGTDGNEFLRELCRQNVRLACILCTGSPEYHLPADITTLPHVSDHVFAKPVIDLSALEDALRRQIETYHT